MHSENTTETHQSEEEIRLEKLNALKEKNAHVFKYNYNKEISTKTIFDSFSNLEEGESNDKSFSLAGRITAKRNHGKAYFANLQDESGTLQFYANLNKLGEDAFNTLLHLDTGDIIGIVGTPFKTRRGELTINITSFEY
jgi:Lysyl-tRNA synthetase (class II)